MSSSGGGGGTSTVTMMRSPFTVSQWQELEHQALIYKYMMAGVPVPPDLVLPIQKSFDSISPSFFHHPSLGYCSFYGKKVDPEPGRCRRTDGKKWRCSKDAYPDSKYCERHMHRGRNRSRKPVESSQQQQTIMTQSAATTTPTVAGTVIDTNSPVGGFHHQAFANPVSGNNQSPYQHHLDAIPYAIPSKDYRMIKLVISSRYLQGVKAEASINRNNFVNNEDSAWPLMQSRVSSSFSTSKSTTPMNDYSSNQSFLNFASSCEPAEKQHHESQSLRPFFDEWPKTRGGGGGGDDCSRSNTSFSSTTQLSISIPTMASPDMISTSSRSSPSESSNHVTISNCLPICSQA
ncbi:Growth-regulating factor 4 [Linum grandiflorum]